MLLKELALAMGKYSFIMLALGRLLMLGYVVRSEQHGQALINHVPACVLSIIYPIHLEKLGCMPLVDFI